VRTYAISLGQRQRDDEPNADLLVTGDDRAQLRQYAQPLGASIALSTPAGIILSGAGGEAYSSLAERLELGKTTVAIATASAAIQRPFRRFRMRNIRCFQLWNRF
jgi:hypothetical protein